MKRAAWTSTCLLLLSVAGCRAPTQITFDVSTDVPCTQLDDTWVTAGVIEGLDERTAPTTVAPRCTTEGRVGSLVVVPSGDDHALVAVRVVAGVGARTDSCASDASRCIVAKRALRFIPHEALTVRVGLDSACEGVTCEGAQTCVDGACRDAVIGDPSQCTGAGCGDEVLGSGDGAVADAGTDATVHGDAGGDGSVAGDASDAGNAGDAGDAAIDAEAGGPIEGGALGTLSNLALGQRAACAILADRTVACWGSNDNGQLGLGDPDAALLAATPRPVAGLDHVTQLTAGQQHFCALRDDGAAWCWGYVGNGATATGHAVNDLVPAPVILAGGGALPAFGRIAAVQNGVCAVTVDALTVWCWGTVNIDSALPAGYAPAPLATFASRVTDLRGGWGFACGTFEDGALRCWGSNLHHVLGMGIADASATVDTPTAVPEAGPVERFSAGGVMACILTPAHRALCWGENDEGDFGPNVNTNNADVERPRDLGFDHLAQVGSGDDHMCALFEDAGVSCWGIAVGGELGYDAGLYSTAIPHAVPNLGPATALVVGPRHACARLTDGGIACWGNNESDQLGVGPVGDFPYGAFPLVF